MNTRNHRARLVLTLAILGGGTLLTVLNVRWKDGAMREALVLGARLAAGTVNPHRIRGLSGGAADLERPEYHRLKSQLAALKRSDPRYRFVYLMGRRDEGQVFFFVDSEPAGSAAESPPGQVYAEATAELLGVFQSARSVAEGPVSDAWGTFVSGLAPVVDPRTKKAIALLGLDITVADWNAALFVAAIPPLLLTLLLLLLLVADRIIVQRARLDEAIPRWIRFKAAGQTLIVGLVLTAFATWAAHHIERRDRTNTFRQLAEGRTRALADTFYALRDTELEGLARFYEGSDEVTPTEFQHYTAFLLENPAVQAWAWVPFVPAADRSRFERVARQAGMADFMIWQEGAAGKREPVVPRESYYPVSLANPLAGNEHALGFDLGSEAVRHAALEEAARTGYTTASDPIRMVLESVTDKGVLVFRPVYHEARSRSLQGFVLAVLRISRLLESTGQDREMISLGIAQLHPETGIHQLAVANGAPDSGYMLQRPVFAFGKAFLVSARATRAYLRRHPVGAGLLTAFSGVLLSTALAFVVGMTVQRRRLLEELVVARTRELGESEARFQAFMDETPVYAYLKDGNRRYLYRNRLMLDLAEKDRTRPAIDAVTIETLAAADTAVLSGAQPRAEVEFEIRIGEKTRWLYEIKFPLLMEDGRRLLGGMAFDITDRVRLQDQLHQAQKMESIGRLAGGVAHDFNNMLAVIFSHVERLLQQSGPGNPLHPDLLEIRQAAERSAEVARQLLAFARRQTIAPRILDLNATVDGMLKMLRRLLGEHITLTWLPGESLAPVRMDPSQLDQILTNLCVNARDAVGDAGRITIETGSMVFDEEYCAMHAGFRPGEYVLLAVSDDGCGMDRETLSHVFEPFFTTKAEGEGTGLGLPMIYGIVKQNDGFINAYSEPGHGTRFTIYLPGQAGETIEAPVQAAVAAAEAAQGGETILLVEDEPAIHRITRMMLEELGYRVLAAAAPEEALAKVEAHDGAIDLLVTDVIMPGMNGRELAGRLQARYPQMLCLFMSGYTANVIAHHGVLDAGVQFMQKPFFVKDLAQRIREMLDGRPRV